MAASLAAKARDTDESTSAECAIDVRCLLDHEPPFKVCLTAITITTCECKLE